MLFYFTWYEAETVEFNTIGCTHCTRGCLLTHWLWCEAQTFNSNSYTPGTRLYLLTHCPWYGAETFNSDNSCTPGTQACSLTHCPLYEAETFSSGNSCTPRTQVCLLTHCPSLLLTSTFGVLNIYKAGELSTITVTANTRTCLLTPCSSFWLTYTFFLFDFEKHLWNKCVKYEVNILTDQQIRARLTWYKTQVKDSGVPLNDFGWNIEFETKSKSGMFSKVLQYDKIL